MQYHVIQLYNIIQRYNNINTQMVLNQASMTQAQKLFQKMQIIMNTQMVPDQISCSKNEIENCSLINGAPNKYMIKTKSGTCFDNKVAKEYVL